MKSEIYTVVLLLLISTSCTHAMDWEGAPAWFGRSLNPIAEGEKTACIKSLIEKQRVELDLFREFNDCMDRYDGTGRSETHAFVFASETASEFMKKEWVSTWFRWAALYQLFKDWCTDRWQKEEEERKQEDMIEYIELAELQSSDADREDCRVPGSYHNCS